MGEKQIYIKDKKNPVEHIDSRQIVQELISVLANHKLDAIAARQALKNAETRLEEFSYIMSPKEISKRDPQAKISMEEMKKKTLHKMHSKGLNDEQIKSFLEITYGNPLAAQALLHAN